MLTKTEIEKIKKEGGYSVIICKKCRAHLIDGGCIINKSIKKLLDKNKAYYIGGEPMPASYKQKCPKCGLVIS